MIRQSAHKFVLLGVIISFLLVSGCYPAEEQLQKPEFDGFSVTPAEICTNLGVPILRITWGVKGEGESCLGNLTINGAPIGDDIWGVGILGTRCGEGNYTRESAFSLRDAFGFNVPSQITVAAELTRKAQAGVFVGNEVVDSSSATAITRECTVEFSPGG